MRASEAAGFAVLAALLAGCAAPDAERLALRDRIEQGGLAPEDTPRFFTSPLDNAEAQRAAREIAPRLATPLDAELLAAAETEAKARGCARATLDTYSFQAPQFYQRLGYRIVAAVDDMPAGHTHYTLVKDF